MYIVFAIFVALKWPLLTLAADALSLIRELEALNDQHLAQLVPYHDQNNIEHNLVVPEYDNATRRYTAQITTYDSFSELPSPQVAQLVQQMEKQASDHQDQRIYLALADVYMFGNFSVQPNYQKAFNFYETAVKTTSGALSSSQRGHAYFMLGFIHSTGVFGEFPTNQALATLHYQFGMENGDANAILALAYRTLNGIGTPANCELALHYYTRLAHLGARNFTNTLLDGFEDEVHYNIRIPDFNGGLYGKVSETSTSIVSNSKLYSSSKDTLNEYHFDVNSHSYMHYYYQALDAYEGDYFTPKNLTKAAEILTECVEDGEHEYGGKANYKNIEYIDLMFLSHCQALLGRILLKRQTNDKQNDYKIAYNLLRRSIALHSSHEALNDFAYMYENELTEKSANKTKAILLYKQAIQLRSPEARLNLAKFLIRYSENSNVFLSENKKYIYNLVHGAVYSGLTEAFYHFGEFMQSGLGAEIEPEKDYSCDNVVIYYKFFTDKLENHFIPHLRFAFESLRYGNFQNSLIGYLIAAEQGLENAQVSAAYLLYQPPSLLTKIFYPSSAVVFQKERISSAINYLELASAQGNLDATIMLGDMYWNGVGDFGCLPRDYNKAFTYYSKGALQHSSHACFNLAMMYEYGLGPINNTVDFHMAKRYYDLSLKYRHSNRIPINMALLRLRLKYLFSFNDKAQNGKYAASRGDSGGWLKAFKSLGKKTDSYDQQSHEKQQFKATSHHEGTTPTSEDDEYDAADYLVIILSVVFFAAIFVHNFVRQFRRMRDNGNRNANAPPGQNDPDHQDANGANAGMANGVNQFEWHGNLRGRFGNMEFQFFAL